MKSQKNWATWELYTNETTSIVWGGIPVEIIESDGVSSMYELETFSVSAQFDVNDQTVSYEPVEYRKKKLYFRIPYSDDLYQIYCGE